MSFDVRRGGDFSIRLERSGHGYHAVGVMMFFHTKEFVMTIDQFKSLFKYDPSKVGYLGVERECFIVDADEKIVPSAEEVLAGLESGIQITPWHPHWAIQISSVVRNKDRAFGYELSACQMGSRIGPCRLEDLNNQLQYRDKQLESALRHYDLHALHVEVGPEDTPLDVYPDPTGRYQRLTKNMPREILSAACRVIGTHVHVGMRDHDMALRVYNYVVRHFAELCELGNGSFGERLAIYKQMAPDYEPKPYASWEEYYQTALLKGFAEDPRKCWTLIRISVHGTIEFRMFGATDSTARIVKWATRCRDLCQAALSAS